MKTKWKSFALAALAVFIVAGAVYAPVGLFRRQDDALYGAVHERQRNDNSLELNLEEMDQVKSIRKIYSPGFVSEDFPIAQIRLTAENEIQQLSSSGILTEEYAQELKDSAISQDLQSILYQMDLSRDVLQTNLEAVSFRSTENPEMYGAVVMLDPFTHKIVTMEMKKEGADFLQEDDTKNLMRRYLTYLGLHVIDDWQYDKNIAVSQKAALRVLCNLSQSDEAENPKTTFSISLLPL